MPVSDWISEYKVGIVESIEESGGKGTKALKVCRVDIGDGNNKNNGNEEQPTTIVTVVTSAPNVRLKSRLAVAPIGSTVLGPSGEGIRVVKTSVGGFASEGIFCDSRMLAWEGGSVGIAAQMNEDLALGSSPPAHKPRPRHAVVETELPESNVEGLFQKKLTKEEKKKLHEEKKKARKAAKEAKAAAASKEGDA